MAENAQPDQKPARRSCPARRQRLYGVCLLDRYERLADPADLDSGLEWCARAANAAAPGRRWRHLASLGIAHTLRFDATDLLCGLAFAESGRLRDSLRAQGDAGVAAFARLTQLAATNRNRFSQRTLRALERAAAGGSPVDDEALLREILSEPSSSARSMLERLGVRVDQLLDGNPGTADRTGPADVG